MDALRLALRGLWWRRGVSAAILSVAVVTTAAAALGPLWARAAGESTLRQDLRAAAGSATGLSYHTSGDVSQPDPFVPINAAIPRPGALLGYPLATHVIEATTTAGTTNPANGLVTTVTTTVVYREGACGHLVLVAGRCPRGPDEAMVADRTVRSGYHWGLGVPISLGRLDRDVLVGNNGQTASRPVELRTVGVYLPRSRTDPFWFGNPYFAAGAGGGENPDVVDAVFVDAPFFAALSFGTSGRLAVDLPLDPSEIRLDDLPRLQREVAAELRGHPLDSATELHTSLPSVLAAAAHERGQLDLGSLLVTLQLALLAWLVLFLVVTDASESRGDEIASAKLRGLRPRSILVFGLLETVLLLCVAVPIGFGIARLAAGALAGAALLPGTPVLVRASPIVAALVALAGGLVAATLAARRTLTRPVLEQWRRAAQRVQRPRWTPVVDVVVSVVAVLGILRLRLGAPSTGGATAVSLLAPTLLVLAVALVGVRLVPVLGRALLRTTRASTRVGSFLALRQVVRRPAALRLATLLAVATGIATFAVQAGAVAATNREARAAVEVGAAQSAAVARRPGQDVVGAVRRVDPTGGWAMAAARWLPNDGAINEFVLAVDTPRLPAVASWRGDYASLDESAVVADVAPAVPGPVPLTGAVLRLHVNQRSFGGGAAEPHVVLHLRGAGGEADVDAGPLSPGRQQYDAPRRCQLPCSLTGVTFERKLGDVQPLYGSVVATKLEQYDGAWHPVDAGFGEPDHWYSGGNNPNGHDRVTATAAGLRDTFDSPDGGSPGIVVNDSPRPLPVLATSAAVRGGPLVMIDQEYNTAPIRLVGSARVLPVVLGKGAVVDVTYAQRQLADLADEAQWLVLLSPAAPADAVPRLRAAGLVIDDVQTAAGRQQQLARQGPALGLLLFLVCAVVGAVLAAGVTVVAVAVGARRRSFELAALRAVGVPNGALRRACVAELMLLLGCGLVLGVPSGLLAAWLALPAVPEFPDQTAVPLLFAPHLRALAILAGILVVVLGVTAVLVGRWLVRAAVPVLLREAAP